MTTLFSLESSFGIFGAIYFTWLCKNWFWYVLIGYIMQIIGTIAIFFVPESPKWLIKSRRFDEAQRVLHKVATMNKTDISLVSHERVLEYFEGK